MSNYASAMMKLVGVYHGFVNVVQDHLVQSGIKLNAQQALILYKMEQSGKTVFKAGDIRTMGIYTGTNATYNLKSLVKDGYVASAQSDFDKRSVNLTLTDLGIGVAKEIGNLLNKQAKTMSAKHIKQSELSLALQQVASGLDINLGVAVIDDLDKPLKSKSAPKKPAAEPMGSVAESIEGVTA